MQIKGNHLLSPVRSEDAFDRSGGLRVDSAPAAVAEIQVVPFSLALQECGAVVTGNPPEGQQKAGEEDEEEEEEVVDCSICMCAVTGEPDAASLDKCTHAFHFACIIKVGLPVRGKRCRAALVVGRPKYYRFQKHGALGPHLFEGTPPPPCVHTTSVAWHTTPSHISAVVYCLLPSEVDAMQGVFLFGFVAFRSLCVEDLFCERRPTPGHAPLSPARLSPPTHPPSLLPARAVR